MQSAPAPLPQWSAPALPPVGDNYLDHIEHNLPVRLIATLGTFTAALADEPVATAAARAAGGRFSFLSVRAREGGAVVGLFHVEEHTNPSATKVREAMEPLCGSNLIGAGAPLLDFVTTAYTNSCRLVLSRPCRHHGISNSQRPSAAAGTNCPFYHVHPSRIALDRTDQTSGRLTREPVRIAPGRRGEAAAETLAKNVCFGNGP